MIKYRRHKRILSILQGEGVVDLAELKKIMPEVSLVTLRRDIAELADAGLLKRTHGGAVLVDNANRPSTDTPHTVRIVNMASQLEGLDAIILPPVKGSKSNTLRRQIIRSGIPFLAESAPQTGGVFLGPDNIAATRELGRLAGYQTSSSSIYLLLICQPNLSNTQQRSNGFEEGFRESYKGSLDVIRVNGQGNYKVAMRVALDAFRANGNISVVFGVNDHSVLAGIDSAEYIGATISAYAAGGENPDFVGRLSEGGALQAVAAFFPDVVGAHGIDLVANALAGRSLPEQALTPYAILTPKNLFEYYKTGSNGWSLRQDKKNTLMEMYAPSPVATTSKIGIMPHYPAHDWYRIMIQSMQERAAKYGHELVVSPPHQSIAAEISRLRREIAITAAQRVSSGQTIILGEGEATHFLADELRRLAFKACSKLMGVTIITNALDIMMRLEDAPHLKVILTSGEYQKADRCLVGASLGALFERMRADIAFLSVAGVSPEFGVSAEDECLALVGSQLIGAARRVVILADHTVIGADANHRIARPGEFHEIITDDGALPTDCHLLRDTGVEVSITNDVQVPTWKNSETRKVG